MVRDRVDIVAQKGFTRPNYSLAASVGSNLRFLTLEKTLPLVFAILTNLPLPR
jgi:hypothetical protein